MSPEVGLEIGYRTEADVYSYGILLWEMCSLNKPFAEYKTADEFEQAVFIRGVRPSMKKHWPRLLRETIDKCWSKRPSQRPSMESVESVLREVKTSLSGGEGGGGERRRPYSKATRRLSINMGHGYILG
jgi:mitogen-activated protein kinase kinase kinase 7